MVLDESLDLAGQMLDDALSTEVPSMVQTSFSTTGWQGVQVNGDTATALVVGSYANCFQGGVFSTSECQTAADMQWQFTLHRGSDAIWRLTERAGVSVDPSPVIEESGPAPSEDPTVDPEPSATTEPTPTVPADPTPTKTPKPTTTATVV